MHGLLFQKQMTVEEPEEMMESMKEARGPNRDKTCKYKGFFCRRRENRNHGHSVNERLVETQDISVSTF